MAQKDIEQWAKILQESEAADIAYERACNESLKEAEDAVNDVEMGEEDEVIDPASVGFLDSEARKACNEAVTPEQWKEAVDWFNANGYPLEDDEARLEKFAPQLDQILFKAGMSPTGKDEVVGGTEAWELYQALKEDDVEDSVDLAECGFTEDGEEIAAREAEDDLNEDFHNDDEYASMELEVSGKGDADGYDTSFEDAVHGEVPEVMVKKTGLVNGDTLRYRVSGFLGDLKKVYAFYLGLYSWDDVVKQGEEPGFNELVVFEDGDTLQEADYRDAIAHVFDPIGVKASTANLKATNTCELSIVKEAVKAEIQKRKAKKLFEAELEDLSDEQLDELGQTLDAGEAVDSGDATAKDERVWLALLKTMGINSIEEYKAMDPEEFNRRFEASNKPSDAANGFARSHVIYKAFHRPDNENGGATSTEFAFNPDYDRRITRAEQERNAKKAEKRARENAPIDFPSRGKDTWSLNEFGKMLFSLGPKKSKELMNTMIEIAKEDNKDNPKAAADEIMFIKKLFGKKITLRDIARAWYPGEDPDRRQQSVNKFCQDTEGNIRVATRRATNTSDGSYSNFMKNVLGNEANFNRFLTIMKDMSDKRAKNKRSLINRGKTPEEQQAAAGEETSLAAQPEA